MKSEAQFTIVQLTLMDQTGDSYYRMRWPAAELSARAPNWRIINLDARASERFTWARQADLLVVYQSCDLELLPIIAERKARGLNTLVEYNDNFYAPPPASPVAREWSSPLLWQNYEQFIELSDALLVTGPGLQTLFAERWAKKEIHILENHFPTPLAPFDSLLSAKSSNLSFGWAGSLGHISDLLALVPVLTNLLNEFPDSKLHLMGNESIPALLPIPANRLEFTKWGSIQEYFDFWRPVRFGVAPLLKTPYNQCRSDIKAVEMGALGVSPILSDALPYEKFSLKTGIPLSGSFSAIEARARSFFNSPEQAVNVAKRAYEYVASERIGANSLQRYEIYSRYLPAEPQASSNSLPVGYHELAGTPLVQSGISSLAKGVQALANSGQLLPAHTQIKAAVQQNPWAADLLLLQFRLELKLNPSFDLQPIKATSGRFPRDLRFPLLIATAALDSKDRKTAWMEILHYLEKSDPQSRRFYRRDVIEKAAAHCRLKPEDVEIGMRLLSYYPEALQLQFVVGEAFEKLGRYAEAADAFGIVRQAVEIKGLNEQFLTGVEENYIQAWHEALKARSE